jgi:D-arabinose 1-dehydrogenase-like Zn-dependent alcohol dehydrogenase
VAATGLCRSDWHGWQGHDRDIRLPHVPGHEVAGTIAAVGRDVRGWSEGDRVTVPFVCACGSCEQCRDGNQQVCLRQEQPGFSYWGSFAEYVAVPWAQVNLVRLPDQLGFDEAATLGCRFATAYRAVRQVGRVAAGEWVAVFGCGGVGLSAVMIGSALGARVVAVDVAAAALDRARELGAEHTVAAGPDTVATVEEITGGGAHVSIDALGSPATAVNSVRCLRRRGRHVQVGLLLGPASAPPLPMDLVTGRELEIYGSHGMAARDYPAMMAMVGDGTLRPGTAIGQVIGLEDIGQALAAMNGPGSAVGMTVARLAL